MTRPAEPTPLHSPARHPQPMGRCLSLGAGVQSTALLILAARGDLEPLDAAIFADTGWEPAAVYAHLDRLEREIAAPAGIPVHRVAAGNIRHDALDPAHRFASMPLYVRNPDGGEGMGRRQCFVDCTFECRRVSRLTGAGRPSAWGSWMCVVNWLPVKSDCRTWGASWR